MPQIDRKDPLLKRTERYTLLARSLLFWERYAPVFAWAGLFVGLFLAGSFAGLWERVGDPWRLIALIAALAFLGRAAWKARTKKLPTTSDAKRRVEHDSGQKHRPLDTLYDRPALSHDVWPEHYQKARQSAGLMHAPRPRPSLGKIDPYYIRFALPVLLIAAIFIGAGDNIERLRRSLLPTWQSGLSADNVSFEVWADPPEYTGRPPVYFKSDTAVEIPAGSELVARVSGARDVTRLKIMSTDGNRYLPLERIGPKSFESQTTIQSNSTARWRIGNFKKTWELTAIADAPPTVRFDKEPAADKRDRLIFSYSFEDDYGVEDLYLVMNLLTEDEDEAKLVKRVEVPLAGNSVREENNVGAALDLTKHEWAGRKVSAFLLARDGLEQSAITKDVYFTVPDKIFVEPLAKAIIENRNLVIKGQQTPYAPRPELTRREAANRPIFDTFETDARMGRAAPSIQRASVLLEAITDEPQGLYEDPAVYMGLRNVLSRLRYAHSVAALDGIPEDLWSIALRAEFGTLGTALEEMREAEQALRDAMARRAPQREIDALFDRYDEAVDRYMEELRRKAMEEGQMSQMPGGGGNATNMDEIQALMEAIEEANRLGDTEGARKALAKLTELLENMQIQMAMGSGGGGEPMDGEMSEEMQESLEDLADMLGEQRELKDETERAQNQQRSSEQGDQNQSAQNGQQGSENQSGQSGQGSEQGGTAPDAQQLAERQTALEDALRALRENLPNEEGSAGRADEDGEDGAGASTDEALDEAARAMGESRSALEDGDLDGAQSAQNEAIEALRRIGEGLAQQAGSNRQGQSAESGEGSFDPLGRENGGLNDENSQADIEQRDNATRSRELLEELRRRSSEQEREQIERDYLERLLDRF